MAGSDEECDLEALSALLEEDSDEGLSAMAMDAAEKAQAVKLNTQCFAEDDMDTGPAEEDMDMEALSSMLDQDSDLEDSCSQQEQQEVTADDIAAFFNETSDSEKDGETEDGDGSKEMNGQLRSGGGFEPQDKGGAVKRSESSTHGSAVTHSGSDNDTPGADQHVKQLQDELAMMQQRMMEIQQMLASQTSTAAAVPQPGTQPSSSPKPQTKQPGSSKTASTSSSSDLMSSSPTFSKTSSSSRKIKSYSSSPALTKPEKKPSPTLLASEKSKTSGSTTSHATNGTASSRLHSSLHKKSQSQRTAAGKQLDGAGQRVASGTKKEQIHTMNNSQCKGVREKTDRRDSHEQLDSAGQRISNGTKKEQIHTTNNSQSKAGIREKAERQDSHELGSKKKKPSSTFLADVAESRGDASHDRQSLKRSLFGDDDSNSDWEDEEGDKARLSSGGQEIQRLLVQGQRQRQAHTPSYSLPSATAATWKSKAPTSTVADRTPSGSLHGPSTSASVSTSARKEPDTKDYTTEKFSGLRIINPKVSSVMLASKMEGRRMIPVSRLHLKVNTPDLQGDWVTIGVIVHKSEARKSQTGKTYSLWKLSDLDDTERTVSFFLFGQVYKHLWKMDVGTVIGLLNPNVMDSMEKGGGDVAFTVNNAQQVMEIGRSKDLGCCVSKTKRGATCTNFVNKKLGDFCTYHVQAAYRRQSAKRGELHGSCPGTAPKSSLKSKILQNNTFFYGGECYTASQGKGRGRGKKDKVTLTKLQAVMTQQEQRKVNTLAIQNLMPDHAASVQSALTAQHQRPFLDMLSVPTAGSMNLVRHIAKAEGKIQDVKRAGKGEPPAFQSVNARDLLKQHREQIAERISSHKQQRKTSSQNGQQPQAKTPGQTRSESPEISRSKSSEQSHSKRTGQLYLKNSGQSNSRIPGQSHSKSTGQLHSKNSGQSNSRIPGQSHSKSTGQLHSKNSGIPGQMLSKSTGQLHVKTCGQSNSRIPGQLQCRPSQLSETSASDKGLHTPASSKVVEGSSDCANPPRSSSGADAPKLGKGFYPGKNIDLFGESSASSQRKPTPNDMAMAAASGESEEDERHGQIYMTQRKAIEKVRAMGGLEKADPNATRPTAQNPDKVRKRVLENIENAHKATEGGDGDRRSPSAAEPARKKSRLLGNVDPSSEEVKQLLSARSSHTGALAQAEAEREERYFDQLEQKEKMEEKMKTVTAMEVTVVTCEQCKYTAVSQSDRCKQERHTVRRHKGKRRFFACKKCKHRTVSLHRYPTSPCKKCGEHSYEKTSMHQEKTGPKLECEVLCLRGDESKFVNAMDQKVFLSTVVQD